MIAADDVTLDRAGHNVIGSGAGDGIRLVGRTGVTRAEPEMMPAMVMNPWDPADPFMSGIWKSVE